MNNEKGLSLEKIVKLLKNTQGISDWRIVNSEINTEEYFFVKKILDMQRTKNIQEFDLTVYCDFEEDGKKYRGSVETSLYPTMKEEEIRNLLRKSIESAKHLKNPYYPIPSGSASVPAECESIPDSCDGFENQQQYIEALFAPDCHSEGGINSCEVSFERSKVTILNSRGIEVTFPKREIFTEVVLDWKGTHEEVEILDSLRYQEIRLDQVKKDLQELFFLVSDRAIAEPTPTKKDFPVVLSHSAVSEFLSFYSYQTYAKSVYRKSSQAKIGESVQGKNPTGDLLTVEMLPSLDNNPDSCRYDSEGAFLVPLVVIEKGIVKNFYGEQRYLHYLGLPATGNHPLFKFLVGSMKRETLLLYPHLEVALFSDFQMDEITGDFAGEIRLGWIFDGKRKKPVTAGSISGNLHLLEEKLRFSTQSMIEHRGEVPDFIYLPAVNIAGD